MAEDFALYGEGPVQTFFYVVFSAAFAGFAVSTIVAYFHLRKTAKLAKNVTYWMKIAIFGVVTMLLRMLAYLILLIGGTELMQSSFVGLSDIFLGYAFMVFIYFWMDTCSLFSNTFKEFTEGSTWLNRKKKKSIFVTIVTIISVLVFVSLASLKKFPDLGYYTGTITLMIMGVVVILAARYNGKQFIKVVSSTSKSEVFVAIAKYVMVSAWFLFLAEITPIVNVVGRIIKKK